MDRTEYSELIGGYFRLMVTEKTEHHVQSLRDGAGESVANPFTGEVHKRKVAGSIAALAALLAERGLNKDAKFMTALAAAAAEIAEAPIRGVLHELRALEQVGDGGPDPEFTLAAPNAQPVQMDAVIKGFERKQR